MMMKKLGFLSAVLLVHLSSLLSWFRDPFVAHVCCRIASESAFLDWQQQCSMNKIQEQQGMPAPNHSNSIEPQILLQFKNAVLFLPNTTWWTEYR